MDTRGLPYASGARQASPYLRSSYSFPPRVQSLPAVCHAVPHVPQGSSGLEAIGNDQYWPKRQPPRPGEGVPCRAASVRMRHCARRGALSGGDARHMLLQDSLLGALAVLVIWGLCWAASRTLGTLDQR